MVIGEYLSNISAANKFPFDMSNMSVPNEFQMEMRLFQAVRDRKLEKLRELTSENPQILKTLTPLGNTALHVAASRKDDKLADLLLLLKPCITLMKNIKQETALHTAAAAGCLEVTELLLKLKSSEIRCNSSGCVHLEGYDLEGGRLNLDDLWQAQNVNGETAHYAVRGGNVKIASLLLDKVKGVEKIVNKDGESALYTACQELSEPLLKKLGDIHSISATRRVDKTTCLHQLLMNSSHGAAVSDLLRRRPSLATIEDDKGNAPLHLASIGGKVGIVEELLKEAPEMALRKNNKEMAAIHYAALMGDEAIVRCLIQSVPHCVEMLGEDNKTALHFALEYGHTSTATTLLHKSMNPSFLISHADNDGQTAFHKAASSSQLVSLVK